MEVSASKVFCLGLMSSQSFFMCPAKQNIYEGNKISMKRTKYLWREQTIYEGTKYLWREQKYLWREQNIYEGLG